MDGGYGRQWRRVIRKDNRGLLRSSTTTKGDTGSACKYSYKTNRLQIKTARCLQMRRILKI
uniref:Uncharacterized protein n=1 Tax=Romanomermis culicivorax TaxID=13658 RepID=A0A915I618_ROMCU